MQDIQSRPKELFIKQKEQLLFVLRQRASALHIYAFILFRDL